METLATHVVVYKVLWETFVKQKIIFRHHQYLRIPLIHQLKYGVVYLFAIIMENAIQRTIQRNIYANVIKDGLVQNANALTIAITLHVPTMERAFLDNKISFAFVKRVILVKYATQLTFVKTSHAHFLEYAQKL